MQVIIRVPSVGSVEPEEHRIATRVAFANSTENGNDPSEIGAFRCRLIQGEVRALIIASIALLIGQAQDKPVDQPKAVRAVIVGMWKVDTKYGYPAKVTEWGANIDWIITFKEDGTYVWAVYEPFVEGVGRRHRDTKGTYVVNLDDNLLVLRTTELTGKRVALQSILAEDRKAFVIPSSDPKQPENKIRFIRVEPRGK